MTQKEILNVIKTKMSDDAEVVNFCDKMSAAIDNKNAKARARAAAKKAAGDAITDALHTVLTSTPQTLVDIAAQIPGASPNKIASRIAPMVDIGAVTKAITKVNKKRITVYSVA
jgi:hypothetical protein